MKLGLCSWSYNRTFASGKMDMEKLLHVCADDLKIGGIDMIDIHLKSQEPDYLLKIKKLVHFEAGLTKTVEWFRNKNKIKS